MSNYATKDDLKTLGKDLEGKIDKAVGKAVDDLSAVIANFAEHVDERFTQLEKRQDELEKKFDQLLNTIDKFVARIDKYETEQEARDRQFERLVVWARKVSKKTGIPLESL